MPASLRSSLVGASVALAATTFAPSVMAICDWPVNSDPNLVNIAYPDTNATYWGAVIPAAPGMRLRIEGRYPNARYFSYNVYDGLLRPTDAIADVELEPDAGGNNSFRDTDQHFGDSYTAYVEIGKPPAEGKAANTIYTGAIKAGEVETADIVVIGMLYRVYVSHSNNVLDGGVGLPKLIMESPDGEMKISLKRCGPFNESPTGDSTVNDVTRDTSYPLPGEANQVPYVISPEELKFRKFHGFGNTAAVMSGVVVDRLQQDGDYVDTGSFQSTPVTGESNGGFLSNVHNAYGTFLAHRDEGSLYVIRAKAPTWRGATSPSEEVQRPGSRGNGNGRANRPDPFAAQAGQPEQLRYWSLCTNEFHTLRYVACLRDSEVALDEDGYYTLVVSDESDRPDNAITADGVNWLAWGGLYYDSLFIYRHMLPSPDFVQSIQNVPFGKSPADTMGEYAPVATYCDRATVESVLPGANLGARIMAACQSAR